MSRKPGAIHPTVLNVTHLSENWIALMLAVFGVGTMFGKLSGGWLYDKYKFFAVNQVMIFSVVVLSAFPLLSQPGIGITAGAAMLGCMVALTRALQMRLMDMSKHGQSLVAASNHAALNFANALGPWICSLTINAGWGWTSTGYVGAAMALAGCLIYLLARALEKRSEIISD